MLEHLLSSLCVHKVFKSGIDKSDESAQYPRAVCAFFTGVISDQLFLREFVFDLCMLCCIFVSQLILWILKNFVV